MPVIGTLFFENEVNKVCIFDKNSIIQKWKDTERDAFMAWKKRFGIILFCFFNKLFASFKYYCYFCKNSKAIRQTKEILYNMANHKNALESYIQEIGNSSLLTDKQERELAERIRQQNWSPPTWSLFSLWRIRTRGRVWTTTTLSVRGTSDWWRRLHNIAHIRENVSWSLPLL